MLGFLTLIEAENLSFDLPDGGAWREAAPLSPVAGSFETTPPLPSNTVTGPAGLVNGQCLLFDDLPFSILDASADPSYVISRLSDFETPAVVLNYYDLGTGANGAAACERFTDKRAYLLQAFDKLCNLSGYNIHADVDVTPGLKKAQLLCAMQARESGASGFYALLLNAGVKREKRGDAETEFFTPKERLQTEIVGEIANLLKGYRRARSFGAVLRADQNLNLTPRPFGN